MALTKAFLTGRVPFADDAVPAYAVAVFTLTGYDTQGSDIVIPIAVKATLVNGVMPAGFSLWANTLGLRGTSYRVSVIEIRTDANGGMPVEYETKLANIQIASTPTTQTIASLLNNPAPDAPSWNVNIRGADYAALLADIASASTAATTATAQAVIATTQATTATTQAGIATAQAGVSTAQATISTDQAAIATSAAASIVALDILPIEFSARSALVSAIGGGLVPLDGVTYRAGGLKYIGVFGATSIADMPGLAPLDGPYPDHYADNVAQGVTDMAASINNALSDFGKCYFLQGTYAVGSTIAFDNKKLIGVGAHGKYTRILGLSASIPIGSAILRPGRSSEISGLRVSYDAITGAEVRDERVGIDTRGATFQAQRGSIINDIYIGNVGTAVSDYGASAFSVTFGTMEIGPHSFAAFDLRYPTGTGNTWGNIYINGGDAYTATYGFNCEAGRLGDIGLINIEHNIYSGAALRIVNAKSGSIGQAQIEGVDIASDGGKYIEFDRANVQIAGLAIINTRASFDNLKVFKLGDAYFTTPGASDIETQHNTVRIGSLQLRGIATPNSELYPSYPSARRGLQNVAGYKLFNRDSGKSGEYHIDISDYSYGAFSGQQSSFPFLKYGIERYSNSLRNIVFDRVGLKGKIVQPRKNILTNGAFDTWVNPTVSGVTSATETATGWFAAAASGTLNMSRQNELFGRDNSYTMRAEVTVAGNFQEIKQTIIDWRHFVDADAVLSFEMKAAVAGRVFDQITCSLTNTGGTPALAFNQVFSGSNPELDAETYWNYYEFPFKSVLSSSITSFGAAPTFAVLFSINGASALRTPTIDIRNVKLERATGGSTRASSFSR